MTLNKDVLEMIVAERRRVARVTTAELFDLASLFDEGIAELGLAGFEKTYLPAADHFVPAPPTIEAARPAQSGGGPTTAKSQGTGRRGKGKKTGARAERNREAREAEAASPAREPSVENRDAVRAVLLSFAQDLSAGFDDPKELIRVMSDVEKYLNRIFVAANKRR